MRDMIRSVPSPLSLLIPSVMVELSVNLRGELLPIRDATGHSWLSVMLSLQHHTVAETEKNTVLPAIRIVRNSSGNQDLQ